MKLLRSCLLWLLAYAAGYVVLAAALDLVLRRFFPPPGGRYAALVIAGLCVLLSGFFWQAWQSNKERSLLARASRGRFRPEPGRLAVAIGQVQVLGTPLEAPFSGEPCAAYEYDVLDPSRRTESGHAKDYTGMALTPCEVVGQTGSLKILGWPQLEGFPEEIRDGPEVVERAASYITSTTFETVSLANFGAVFGAVKDMITDVDGSFRKDLQLGGAPADLGGRRFQERVVPVGSQVCAYGVYDAQQRGLLPGHSAGVSLRLVFGGPAPALQAARGKVVSQLVTGTLLLLVLIGAALGVTAVATPSFGEAMIAAARRGNVPALQGLLAAGADVDSRGVGGETALMFAQTEPVARLLVAYGADVNATDFGGQTPLMLAADKGRRKLVELYLAAGADLTATNQLRKTALDIAREKGNQELVDLLLRASGESP